MQDFLEHGTGAGLDGLALFFADVFELGKGFGQFALAYALELLLQLPDGRSQLQVGQPALVAVDLLVDDRFGLFRRLASFLEV